MLNYKAKLCQATRDCICVVLVGELEQYLDPMYVDQISLSTDAKADLILAG